MIQDKNWSQWVMQTARSWEDIEPLIEKVGVAPVDNDHKRLIEYVLELSELLLSIEKEFSVEKVQEQQLLLERFLEFTQIHFMREEQLIKKYGFEGLEEQEHEHQLIMDKLHSVAFEFATGRLSSAFRLRLDLLNWMIRHINTTDKEVFDFLNLCMALLHVDSWDDIKGFIASLHIPILDYQHKKLIESIMKVGKKIRECNESSCPEPDELITLLNSSIILMEEHFQTEERIIKEYNIQGLQEQSSEHSSFLQYIYGQLDLLKEHRMDKLEELEQELLFWWIQHINIKDYNTFSNSKWVFEVFRRANSIDDIAWLISPTGIDKVDTDHKEFVSLLLGLKYLNDPTIRPHEKTEERLEELHKIIEYAKGHFQREEIAMQDKDPEIQDRHKKEHIAIIEKLEEHYKALKFNLIDTSSQLRNTLLFWWVGHTNGMDFETFGAHYDE